jgi:hypothetical protein
VSRSALFEASITSAMSRALAVKLDRVGFLDLEGGDGHAAAVDLHMAVVDELARRERRRHEFAR